MRSGSVGIASAYRKVGGEFQSHVAVQYVTTGETQNKYNQEPLTMNIEHCLSDSDGPYLQCGECRYGCFSTYDAVNASMVAFLSLNSTTTTYAATQKQGSQSS